MLKNFPQKFNSIGSDVLDRLHIKKTIVLENNLGKIKQTTKWRHGKCQNSNMSNR